MIERKSDLLPWIVAVLALGWRLTAPWLQQSAVEAGDLSELDHTMFVTLGVMGLGFVACGLIAHCWARTWASWLFALYATLAGLHWGGPLGLSTSAWVVYLFVSGFISEALLLHFTLVFPRPPGWNRPCGSRAQTPLVSSAPCLRPRELSIHPRSFASGENTSERG